MVVCEVCQLEGQFYVSDGATFCQGCGAESQDHGQQVVVDDETMGVFDSSVAGTLKTKRIRGSRRGKAKRFTDARLAYLRAFKVSFTTADAFSYILKQVPRQDFTTNDFYPFYPANAPYAWSLCIADILCSKLQISSNASRDEKTFPRLHENLEIFC